MLLDSITGDELSFFPDKAFSNTAAHGKSAVFQASGAGRLDGQT
jgi:hypothetical protein